MKRILNSPQTDWRNLGLLYKGFPIFAKVHDLRQDLLGEVMKITNDWHRPYPGRHILSIFEEAAKNELHRNT